MCSYYFSAVADRAGGGEKLFGRLILAVWQDKSMPSNSFYFFQRKRIRFVVTAKDSFYRKRKINF